MDICGADPADHAEIDVGQYVATIRPSHYIEDFFRPFVDRKAHRRRRIERTVRIEIDYRNVVAVGRLGRLEWNPDFLLAIDVEP